ncbi:MAG TPA: gliding motility-associated C-terminal domain-containing protein [Bacteroidales bacterium]|nr:gliding motility-associated C-terminal domain-containing protein [Bacteroidales bacterium]
MKRAILAIFFLVSAITLKATHNRAGEITYRQISQYEFEFTITTFTYTLSAADRDALEIQWGDNSYSIAPRVQKDELPDFYRKNTYVVKHTFPGPGTYEIVMQDPNRNYGVVNIPNSVNVIFSVKTTMVINPVLGTNNTPVLLNYPIDKAAVHKTFIHNPAAFDIDGDSLSYKLTVCTKENGQPIENYSFPETDRPGTKIYVDSITGDLVWDAPKDSGIFNIAMNIEEWRNGIKINNIIRDMQVEVHDSKNNPPENPPLKNICIVAGDSIVLSLTSIDKDNDKVTQTATGGPFAVKSSPATFKNIVSDKGVATSVFRWLTDCSHVRKQPYTVVLKAEDNNAGLKLVDLDNFNIHIMAPAPENLKARPSNNAIMIKWSKSICPNAAGYMVYRSTSSVPNVTDSCVGGIRAGSGYELIKTLSGRSDTTFTDNNQGTGLHLGINYCYRVVAFFADGALSYPSDEACSTLIPGNPSLLQASVTKVDDVNGEVYVSWAKPVKLDTIPALGPYEYIVYRSNNLSGNNFAPIKTYQTANLLDTFIVDGGLNTKVYPYVYKVELYNNASGNRFLIGNAEVASTMYPDLLPQDNQVQIKFARNVPWLNERYVIYRQNKATLAFDSVGTTDTELYVDQNLANNVEVCYRVKSYGFRELNGARFSNINWSHVNCTTPIDTTKPCAPTLNVNSICDSSVNVITWNNPNLTCANDVVSYKLYYKNQINSDMQMLAEINDPNVTTFRHVSKETLAACYQITAIDSFGNESIPSTMLCIDNCIGYDLPNVFTPNNDGQNDIFKSYNPNTYVKKVNMKIFNRWGKLVFKTENADINWDGRDIDTKNFVPTGIYYYICDVFEPRLTGVEARTITGFIHLYYDEGAKPFIE